MLSTKHVECEFLKAVSEKGSFEGLLSPYNYVDSGGDSVDPRAFEKNISEKGNVRPLLWQHMSDQPIGSIELQDRADGLHVKGQLLLSIPQAKVAYDLIRAGIVRGLSIGYKTVRSDVQNGIRHLKELVLYEGSVVTFPMAEAAQVSAVKSIDHTKIEASIAEFKRDVLAALTK